MVSASDLEPEGREFEPWPVHPRRVLRRNTTTLKIIEADLLEQCSFRL